MKPRNSLGKTSKSLLFINYESCPQTGSILLTQSVGSYLNPSFSGIPDFHPDSIFSRFFFSIFVFVYSGYSGDLPKLWGWNGIPPDVLNLEGGTGLSAAEDGLELSLIFIFNPLGNPLEPLGGKAPGGGFPASSSILTDACWGCCCGTAESNPCSAMDRLGPALLSKLWLGDPRPDKLW